MRKGEEKNLPHHELGRCFSPLAILVTRWTFKNDQKHQLSHLISSHLKVIQGLNWFDENLFPLDEHRLCLQPTNLKDAYSE